MNRAMLLAAAVLIGAMSGSAYAQGAAPPLRPDPSLTPGANDPSVLDSVPLSVLCVPGYTAGKKADGTKVRDVSEATKNAVFAEYHIDPKGPGAPFEIDHLCSLELGCTNSIRNLWPQSYVSKPWNAHLKDALEDRLHALTCPSAKNPNPISLAEAQTAISTDWIAAYQKYVGQPK